MSTLRLLVVVQRLTALAILLCLSLVLATCMRKASVFPDPSSIRSYRDDPDFTLLHVASLTHVDERLVFSPRDIQYYSVDSLADINDRAAWKFIPSIAGVSQVQGSAYHYLVDEPCMKARDIVCPFISSESNMVCMLPDFKEYEIIGVRESAKVTCIVYTNAPIQASEVLYVKIINSGAVQTYQIPISELAAHKIYRQVEVEFCCKIVLARNYAIFHFPFINYLLCIDVDNNQIIATGSMSEILHIPSPMLVIPGYICGNDRNLYLLANDYSQIESQINSSSYSRLHGIKRGVLYCESFTADGEFELPRTICEVNYTGEAGLMEYFDDHLIIQNWKNTECTVIPVNVK